MQLYLSHLRSALGALTLVTDEQQRVRALEIGDRQARLHRNLREQ